MRTDTTAEFHTRTNREQAKQPKSHTKHWCDHCDRDLVSEGCRCGTCGDVNGNRRLKKDVI